MRKMTTILAILALLASAIPYSMPVHADPGTDVYVQDVSFLTSTPEMPGNTTLYATLRAADLQCTNITVIFSYSTGAGQPTQIMSVQEQGPVYKSDPTVVNGYWNSTLLTPDITKDYSIVVTLLMTGDTNSSNNTMTSPGTLNWKSPDMTVTNMTGAPTAYKGDDYPLTITVANYGNEVFQRIVDIPVLLGVDTVATTTINCTASCSLPVDASMRVVATVPKDKTLNFTAGLLQLTSGLKTQNITWDVTFMEKVPNVSVRSITFDPASGVVKAAQNVTITASLNNTGNGTATDMLVHFAYNGTVISDCNNYVNIAVDASNTTACLWHIPTSDVQRTYIINVTPDPNNPTVKGYLEKALVVLPAPHSILGISDMTFNPTTLKALDNVNDTQDLTVSINVTNTGDLAVTNAVLKLDTGQSQSNLLTNSSINISAGGHAVVVFTFPVYTLEDDTTLRIMANFMKGTQGVYFSKNITVPGDIDVPHYVLNDLSASPNTAQEQGLPASFSLKLKNDGDAKGASVTLKFMAGTSDLGTRTLTNVTVGPGVPVSLVWDIPSSFAPSQFLITVSLVGISGVSVNMTYSVIPFKMPSVQLDFQRDSKGKLKAYSGSAASGKSKILSIEVTVTNSGTGMATNMTLVLKDSKGNVLGSQSQLGVAPGKNNTVVFTIQVKAGTSTKLTAYATFDGPHAIAGKDKGLNATSLPADSPTLKITQAAPGFEAVVFLAAIAVVVVIVGRRK